MTLTPPGDRILLHCCCAPCSGAVVECLVQNGFRPALFFSNSNITPVGEYEKRKGELCRYAEALGLEVIDDDYDHASWLCGVAGLENEPEKGRRCEECFGFRLRRAAVYAAGHGFNVLTTTLASSRWKDLDQVDRAGKKACEEVDGIRWWGQNWRRGGLQERRSEIIREWNFYEQDWCGCEFSRRSRPHPEIMGILNLTPDSFWAPSRFDASAALDRIGELVSAGAGIIDIGAVSTRPGAADVPEEEEWRRLEPVLKQLGAGLRGLGDPKGVRLSVDTFRSGIVRRVYDTVGPFIVNDISAGEDDPSMLQTVGALGLDYIAMHKRGNPRSMDALTDYSAFSQNGDSGVVGALIQYFKDFAAKAAAAGIRRWIADPGFGFAKTTEQNLELLGRLRELKTAVRRPLLVGIADKRFTQGRTEELHRTAISGGADILRVHDVAAAIRTRSESA